MAGVGLEAVGLAGERLVVPAGRGLRRDRGVRVRVVAGVRRHAGDRGLARLVGAGLAGGLGVWPVDGPT